MISDQSLSSQAASRDTQTITLFLCGDVMTGRGIDQVLPYPGNPQIYEPYMTSAKGYVRLAEEVNGPIPKPVDFAYIWGDALEELRRTNPDVRIINLETAVTTSPEFWPGKGINYRMQPRNIPCITAAKIDCCVLANNHVLDWGYAGLTETLTTLTGANLKAAGAGRNLSEAEAPAIIEVAGKGRVLVFGFGDESSGIPWLWGARSDRPGVNLLPDLSEDTVRRIAKRISGLKQKGDCVVASIHWGGNWGYKVLSAQREFAHRLIDQAHGGRGAWSLIAPSQGRRGVPGQTDSVRLRRLSERLRRHFRIRGIPGRFGLDVFCDPGLSDRKAGQLDHDAPANQTLPVELRTP